MSKKAIHKTDRGTISRFDQIINVGPAMSLGFEKMGFKQPPDLIGQEPIVLYQRLCKIDDEFYDPCVLDVLMATVDYMNGNRPRQWWDYTAKRKKLFTEEVDKLRASKKITSATDK